MDRPFIVDHLQILSYLTFHNKLVQHIQGMQTSPPTGARYCVSRWDTHTDTQIQTERRGDHNTSLPLRARGRGNHNQMLPYLTIVPIPS